MSVSHREKKKSENRKNCIWTNQRQNASLASVSLLQTTRRREREKKEETDYDVKRNL
jgi:hypothetical protein